MRIIIPMAGMGKRMRPHTLTMPKPLLKVAGKPIVQRLCEDISKIVGEKTEDIAFVTGHFGKEVEDSLLSIAERMGANGHIYYQEQALGTAHAILCARECLKGKVTVAFADTLFDADFTLDTRQDGIIWTHRVENPSAFGVVKKKNDGTIAGFVEKPKEFVSNEAIIGIYYFRDGENLCGELQYLIDNNITKSGEYQLTDALQNMLDKGLRFRTSDVKEWLDCGNYSATVYTNQRILAIKSESEQLICADAECNESVVIPPVYLGKGVRLSRSVVGPYVSIESGSCVEDSRISNSIVGEQSNIKNTVVADSMIGNHVVLNKRTDVLSVGDYNVIE